MRWVVLCLHACSSLIPRTQAPYLMPKCSCALRYTLHSEFLVPPLGRGSLRGWVGGCRTPPASSALGSSVALAPPDQLGIHYPKRPARWWWRPSTSTVRFAGLPSVVVCPILSTLTPVGHGRLQGSPQGTRFWAPSGNLASQGSGSPPVTGRTGITEPLRVFPTLPHLLGRGWGRPPGGGYRCTVAVHHVAHRAHLHTVCPSMKSD